MKFYIMTTELRGAYKKRYNKWSNLFETRGISQTAKCHVDQKEKSSTVVSIQPGKISLDPSLRSK